MAQHKSAEKRARQTKKRTAVNRARSSEFRSAVRAVEEAIASGDKKAANAALRAAQPLVDRTAQKGLIKQNTGSRKMSRLSARIKAMA